MISAICDFKLSWEIVVYDVKKSYALPMTMNSFVRAVAKQVALYRGNLALAKH